MNYLLMLFHTEQTLWNDYLVNVSSLFPAPLNDVYRDYFVVGSGSVVLVACLGVVVFEMYFSDFTQRALSTVFLVTLLLFSATPNVVVLENVRVPLNILFLPIIKAPEQLVVVFLTVLFVPLFISFRNRLKGVVSAKTYILLNVMFAIFLIMLTLPLLTGEVWV